MAAIQDPPPPVAGSNRAPLSGADLYAWMALRRVSDGLVATHRGLWLESGHRMPGYVTDTLTALAGQRLVTLARPDPWGMARATLTGTGSIRYEQLSRQRKTALRVPPPRFGTTRVRSDPNALASARLITLAEAENVGFVQQHPTTVGLRVSDPQFLTKTPAGRRSSNLAPRAAPDGPAGSQLRYRKITRRPTAQVTLSRRDEFTLASTRGTSAPGEDHTTAPHQRRIPTGHLISGLRGNRA
jgi:hypothetical protein